MSPARLNLSAIPFRSSRLAVPPSPYSPRSPVTATSPTRQRQVSATLNADLVQHIPPPSRGPLKWLWQCHICGRTYQLGVTRRCLDDGHYFCAGTTTIKRRDGSKRTKRHRACASEFDYQGWKEWGVWRRGLLALSPPAPSPCDSVFEDESDDSDVEEITNTVVSPLTPGTRPSTAWFSHAGPAKPKKDCWNQCDYPSECRWGKQFGVATPAQATFPIFPSVPSLDIEMRDALTESKTQNTAPATDFADILTPEQQQAFADTIDGVDENENVNSATGGPGLQDLANLVSRAKRRHSRTEPLGSSPLANTVATSTPSTPTEEENPTQEELRELRRSTTTSIEKGWAALDLEVRRGVGRASDTFSSMVGGWRGSGAASSRQTDTTTTDGASEPVVRGLRIIKRRKSLR